MDVVSEIVAGVVVFVLKDLLFYTGQAVLFVLSFGRRRPRWQVSGWE